MPTLKDEIAVTPEMIEAGNRAIIDAAIEARTTIELSDDEVHLILSAAFGPMLRAHLKASE